MLTSVYSKVNNMHKVLTLINQSNVTDAVQESLLLTLNLFYTFFYCFHCWHWTGKCLLDVISIRLCLSNGTMGKKLFYLMLCAIWYHLYNLKNVETPMEECYF